MKSVVLSVFLVLTLIPAFSQQGCGSAAYLENLLRQNPFLRQRLTSVESYTRQWVAGMQPAAQRGNPVGGQSSVIRIPVVIHIVYNSESENISDAQIQSQIRVLNEDYRRQNPDATQSPSVFKPVAADCEIEFALATTDPQGKATNGIIRKRTDILAFNIDDRVKSSSSGGDDPWNPDQYLNIWVTNMSSGILGYSSLPGGPKETDGVTVQYTAFGTTGTVQAPFNKGRTATHEIGHWLNLIHTWGDTDCGTDQVDDTPPQKGPNRGCPGAMRTTCGAGPYGDMYMNYMDFTDDACMNMFTLGQKARMRSLFSSGGWRNAIMHSTAANSAGASSLADISQTLDKPVQILRLYPNPVETWVFVEFPASPDTPASLGIYNEMGQKVMNLRITQARQQVNLGSLGKGVYIIKAENGKPGTVARLLKW